MERVRVRGCLGRWSMGLGMISIGGSKCDLLAQLPARKEIAASSLGRAAGGSGVGGCARSLVDRTAWPPPSPVLRRSGRLAWKLRRTR